MPHSTIGGVLAEQLYPRKMPRQLDCRRDTLSDLNTSKLDHAAGPISLSKGLKQSVTNKIHRTVKNAEPLPQWRESRESQATDGEAI